MIVKMKKATLCISIIIFILSNQIIVSADNKNSNSNSNSSSSASEKVKGNFYNLTTSNGLSNNNITDIYQDSLGYMWIGTEDGLNKYNGNVIMKYNYGMDNDNEITSTYITSINEDKYGSIWVGTDAGLNIINKNKITKIESQYGKNQSLSDYNITSIFKDSNGVMWVGTINGLNRYDEENNEFVKYNCNGDTNSITNNYITDIDEDDNGYLWISTIDGISLIDVNNYKIYTNENKSDKHNYIYEIDIGKDGAIFIATGDGVIKVTGKGFKIDGFNLEVKENLSNDVKKILYSSNGYIWLSRMSGLIKYDVNKKTTTKYEAGYNSFNNLLSDSINCLYEDRNGVLWIGTENGVSILNVNQQFNNEINNLLNENGIFISSITTFLEDSDSDIWIGTKGNGLIYIYNDKNKLKQFTYDETALSSNSISHIFENDQGVVVTTDKGIDLINKETGEIFSGYGENKNLNININGSNIINNGFNIIYDNDYIWAPTKKGVFKYNKVTGETINYKDIFLKYGIKNMVIFDIFQDENDPNILWLAGGREAGLIKFHKTEGIIKNYVSDSSDNSLSYETINCIKGDGKGNLWIGTEAGLNKFNIKDETFTRYYDKDGLRSNSINSILLDNDNNIWLGTGNGLSKFIINENRFINFTESDGLIGDQFNVRAAYKCKNGDLLFGTTNGVVSFNPETIKEGSNKEDKVIIGNIWVNREVLSNQYENIKLKYNKNNIAIQFSIPDYSRIGGITYLYKMEGINKAWVKSNSDGHASYTTLKPGTYIFKVKASNSNGGFTEETSITFTIDRPFWQSNIAYCIYIIIISLIILYYWYRLRILKKLTNSQTKKINIQLEENKRLYERSLRNEKFKNDYFVNLSHELRTTINIILSAIQVFDSLNKTGSITKEKTLHYINVIRKSSNGLLNIINDIIDSSKIESGTYKINKEENVDIVYLVEETVLSMSEYIKSKGIELIIDPEIEEMLICCDSKEIQRCVINLVSNAVKFTEKDGSITVLIKDKCDTVSISIEDSGLGISEEDQEFIFKRFEQGKNINSINVSSSGIGLTLVKYIVELHGGQVTLESELEKGSNFTIILPKN